MYKNEIWSILNIDNKLFSGHRDGTINVINSDQTILYEL